MRKRCLSSVSETYMYELQIVYVSFDFIFISTKQVRNIAESKMNNNKKSSYQSRWGLFWSFSLALAWNPPDIDTSLDRNLARIQSIKQVLVLNFHQTLLEHLNWFHHSNDGQFPHHSLEHRSWNYKKNRMLFSKKLFSWKNN